MSHQQLSLALSAPAARSERFGFALPRLRLPQRASINGVTAPLRPSTTPPIQDMPTRPALPPLGSPRATRSFAADQPGQRAFSLPLLDLGLAWHTGYARQASPNEDSLAAFQGLATCQYDLVPYALLVVADGMGGHECGLDASRLAQQTMAQSVLQNILTGPELSNEFFLDMLIGSVEQANRVIYQRAQAAGIEMGTTLTAALVMQRQAYIVNVGDSRTYLFRDSAGLIQITHDHSLVASLVAFGQIRPDEIYTHPERNKVYRSLGHEPEVKVDAFILDLQAHDTLLLCSDGLWEMVRDPALERVLRGGGSASLLSDRLLQTALRGGGEDNISVILAQVS